MRDGRVSQQPLHIRLHQRSEIPQRHGERSHNPNEPQPSRGVCLEHNPQQYREYCGFWTRGHESDYWRGSAFIYVWCPDMKWSGGNFKSPTNKNESYADVCENRRLSWSKKFCNFVDAGRTSCAKHQGHAVQEEGSGE